MARNLVQGALGTLCREVPGNIAYFHTYDAVRSRGGGPFLAGLATGAAYSVICAPIESVRAQLVTGVRPLRPTYRGTLPYFTRCITVTGFLQLFYELFLGRQMGLPHDAAGRK